jgi:hypothetical protein
MWILVRFNFVGFKTPKKNVSKKGSTKLKKIEGYFGK